MFPASVFAPRVYPPRLFPKVGGDIIIPPTLPGVPSVSGATFILVASGATVLPVGSAALPAGIYVTGTLYVTTPDAEASASVVSPQASAVIWDN